MRRIPVLIAILSTSSLAADFAPALQWVKTLGGSGISSVTSASADSHGNLYIVGRTTSIDFSSAAAAQSNAGGSPLIRIDAASGKADKLLPPGLSNLTALAADPKNPNTLYAGAANVIFQSLDAGTTWSQLSLIGSTVNGLTVNPFSSNTLYAATQTQGVFKSTDGGRTWIPINNGITPLSDGTIYGFRVWVDPNSSQVLFASTHAGLMRSADGGGSWSLLANNYFDNALTFDPFLPGTVYLIQSSGFLKSTDDGQVFVPLSSLPDGAFALTLLADPINAGVLICGSTNGIYESVDSGRTWTRKSSLIATLLAAEPDKPVFYAASPSSPMVKTTDEFNTTSPIGPPVTTLRQIVVAGPNVFEITSPTNDVFAVKLDPDGNIVYATYFGGSADDGASAIALGSDGSLYVTGTTSSADFPTTAGVFTPAFPESSGTPVNFLFKLNGDGSLAWSTYFADSGSPTKSIAVDSAGNVFVGGSSSGKLPTTPGVYQTDFTQTFFCTGFIGCFPGPTSAFVTKFSPDGKALVYSTFVSSDGRKNDVTVAQALLVDSGGNTWFADRGNIVKLNSNGSALLATTGQLGSTISALAFDLKSNLYATGSFSPGFSTQSDGTVQPQFIFPATPGAFQTAPQPATPILPAMLPPGGGQDAFVIEWDSTLSHILAATLLGGELADTAESIALDGAGNVVISGITDSKAFPTHAPFQVSFSVRSGFVAAFDPSLSHLLYSTYIGDNRPFDARTAILDPDGDLLVAGSTLSASSLFLGGQPGQSFTVGNLIVANKIALPPAPAVRLDSVVNFASRIAAPVAPGEPILAIGSGFTPDAQLLLDGAPLSGVTGTATTLLAVLPEDSKTSGNYTIQVSSGGTLSNPVYVPAALASPGIYSVDGSGFGQGYILNSDGTQNSPENPAAPGSAITIFVAGEGHFTLDHGYAVTDLAPSVYVDGFYANGIAAVSRPVQGLPGDAYQLSVFVPDPAKLVGQNPNLKDFKFPPQVGVKLVMGPVNGLNPANSGSISQDGIVLNVK